MSSYVLVPGAYSGAWYLKEVTEPLEAAGHTVYRCTLTGLGERVHLASPDVGIETHILDVVNVLRYEELEDVILMGHSYGGKVITGVAERVPEKLAHLVYLDALVPLDGPAQANPPDDERRARFQARMTGEGPSWLVPVDWEHGSKDWRRCPHPLRTLIEPIDVVNLAAKAIPRTFIYCTADKQGPQAAHSAISQAAARARAEGWAYHEIDAAHSVLRDQPMLVAELLLALG